jgi:predicted ATP-dependent endonuclease of OLD family
MQLVKAHVTNFRSVEDSGEFELDRVTCLVGKNESGKSAILLALAALFPHPATMVTLDKERDYPRRYLTRYKERNPDREAVVASTVWKLEQIDLDVVASELGDGLVLAPQNVKLYRRYGADHPIMSVEIDTQKAVDNALENQGFDQAQIATLRTARDSDELAEKISSLPSLTPDQTKLRDRLKTYNSFKARVVNILYSLRLPRFMYFASYDRMSGAVQFEQLKALQQKNELNRDEYSGYRLFLEFLNHAGVPIDEILAVKTYETFNAKLQAASNNITDQILEYWTQNPDLNVTVDVRNALPEDPSPLNQGTIGRARIYNQLHRVDTPFSERSAGFVWFFSFLVKFARVKVEGKPVLLLLDEPGLTLHGKAQGDLLRYFDEKLAPHHQIIYSTHSPFMVAPDKLLSARIVEDRVEVKGGRRLPIGTKVRADILTTDEDTLFPLQGALGYEITQTLFIGKTTLLVEGASDILYLQALSHALKARNRVGLDGRWTLCPSGGIGNVRAFVSLFGGNKIDVTVLADQAKGEKKKIEELRRSEILKAGRVFTIADFTSKSESDIEDLFEPELFVAVVNASYELPAAHALTVDTLRSADASTERLVKQAEAAFKVMPDSIPMYDHFTPAAWLLKNLGQLDGDTQPVLKTLDRAESLFKALNSVLS